METEKVKSEGAHASQYLFPPKRLYGWMSWGKKKRRGVGEGKGSLK